MELESTLARIEVMIDNAVADEVRTAKVRDVVKAAATREGDDITPEEIGRGVQFVERYVRCVPAVMREARSRSKGTFAADKMDRMLQAALAYWDAEEDVIPDDQGLLGILDDAYCTLCLIRALSQRFMETTGNPLVNDDLDSPNYAIRKLLGDPIAQQLDDYVVEALADASIDDLLDSLKDSPLPPPPADSSWDPVKDDMVLKLFGVLDD